MQTKVRKGAVPATWWLFTALYGGQGIHSTVDRIQCGTERCAGVCHAGLCNGHTMHLSVMAPVITQQSTAVSHLSIADTHQSALATIPSQNKKKRAELISQCQSTAVINITHTHKKRPELISQQLSLTSHTHTQKELNSSVNVSRQLSLTSHTHTKKKLNSSVNVS